MKTLCYNNLDIWESNIAGWSSSVARRAHNPKAVGSNPAPATILNESRFSNNFVEKRDLSYLKSLAMWNFSLSVREPSFFSKLAKRRTYIFTESGYLDTAFRQDRFVGIFKRLRRLIVQRLVRAHFIVELNIRFHASAKMLFGCIILSVSLLLFKWGKERLGYGII